MLSLILKSLAKILVILSPFLVTRFLHVSIVEQLGLKVGASSAAELEEGIKGSLSLVAGALVFTSEAVNYYEPKKRLEEFVSEYVTSVVVRSFSDALAHDNLAIAKDIRVNVMFVRWAWLPLARHFVWFANAGFDGAHCNDNQLLLFAHQGVAGIAWKENSAKFARCDPEQLSGLNWLERRKFRSKHGLWHCQYVRTQHVLAVLSIPMRKRTTTAKHNPTSKAVGVINIDAVSPAGVAWLEKQVGDAQQRVIEGFLDHGAQLAMTR